MCGTQIQSLGKGSYPAFHLGENLIQVFNWNRLVFRKFKQHNCVSFISVRTVLLEVWYQLVKRYRCKL